MDRLRARVQGPSSLSHDAAQPLHGTFFPRRGNGAGGGTSTLLRVPAPRRGAVCHAVGAHAQLAGTGAGDGNGFYAAGRAPRPPGPEAHLSGAGCIAADWQLRAAGKLRRRGELSRSEKLSFGLVAARLREAA